MFRAGLQQYILFIMSLLGVMMSGLSSAEPEGIVGSIDFNNGHYTAIDNSFEVDLPVRGTSRYVLDSVIDRVTARGTLISVKSKDKPMTYRLETSYAVASDERRKPFVEAGEITFDWYRRLATRAYKGPLVEIITQPFRMNDREALFALYKQFATGNKGPRFHLFYLVDFNDRLAFVWTDVPLAAEDLEFEAKLIDGTAEPARKSLAMLGSLNFR